MTVHSMIHRHINNKEYTLAAIDDVMSRGSLLDWLELRDAIKQDEEVAHRVKQMCGHYAGTDDIRFLFWIKYLKHCGLAYE